MLDYKFPNNQYDEWFEALRDYVESNYVGVTVDVEDSKTGILYESFDTLCDEDYCYSISVIVNQELYPRSKLYALLHEVGHIERMTEDHCEHTFFYQYLDNVEDNLRYRVRTVIEEVLAWHKAEKVAKDLDIELEKRAWQREVERAIELYSLWCAEKGEQNGKENNKS